MSIYLDTSALVKRYDPEESGAVRVNALFARRQDLPVYTSALSTPELASALRRKRNRGDLSEASVSLIWNAFLEDLTKDYQFVSPDAAVLQSASKLIFDHGLRAYDAVQLASALQLAEVARLKPLELRFYTADAALAAVAGAEGLSVPPL